MKKVKALYITTTKKKSALNISSSILLFMKNHENFIALCLYYKWILKFRLLSIRVMFGSRNTGGERTL